MRSKFLPALAILAMMLSMTGVACATPSQGPAFEVENIKIPGAGYKFGCKFTPDKDAQKPASEASSKPELLKPEAEEEAPSSKVQEVPAVDGGRRSMRFERGLSGESPRLPDHLEGSQTAAHAQQGHRRGAARRWAREHMKRGDLRWHRDHEVLRHRSRYPTNSTAPYARSGPLSV